MSRSLFVTMALFLTGCSALAAYQSPDPWRYGVNLTPIGNAREVVAGFIMGAADAGLYTIRVRIAPGGLMPPHRHPDERHITVLSGVLYYGLGETADQALTKRYPAGSYFVVPANAPHFAMGVSGEAIYQESGVAPTGTKWVTSN